jgi:hypothetical protein
MHFVHGFHNGNRRAVMMDYRRRYPLCRIAHREISEYVHETTRGLFFPGVNAEPEQRQCGDEDVLTAAKRRQSANICRIPMLTVVTQRQGCRVLHHDGSYSYCLHRLQHVLPRDYTNRVRFCEWTHPRLNVLFADAS